MIRLTPEEAWQALEGAHTGILTTLRRDGMPITLPVWFVVDGRSIVFRTPSQTKKLERLRHDNRASFLIESGKNWADLRAVHLTGTVQVIEDASEVARLDEALREKYLEFTASPSAMPARTQEHYSQFTFLRLAADERILSWDNSRIRLEQQ